jgi:hypothetical protein
MTTGSRAGVIWRFLVAVDVLVVTVFAVTAATDPYHVLEGQGVEIPHFQGLLPTAVVVALRAAVLAIERRLLPTPRGLGLVLAGRLASLIGFFYLGRWLYQYAYGRWIEVVLGGTLGYALVGIAAIGLAALVHGVTRLHSPERTVEEPTPVTSRPAEPPRPRRELAGESLFGLVGVFLGVAGLAMNVSNLARIAVAVVVAGVAVGVIALVLRRQSG